jgi:two-component sensor histidine kinase
MDELVNRLQRVTFGEPSTSLTAQQVQSLGEEDLTGKASSNKARVISSSAAQSETHAGENSSTTRTSDYVRELREVVSNGIVRTRAGKTFVLLIYTEDSGRWRIARY